MEVKEPVHEGHSSEFVDIEVLRILVPAVIALPAASESDSES